MHIGSARQDPRALSVSPTNSPEFIATVYIRFRVVSGSEGDQPPCMSRGVLDVRNLCFASCPPVPAPSARTSASGQSRRKAYVRYKVKRPWPGKGTALVPILLQKSEIGRGA